MATLSLDRQHTALLIADFYAAMMGTIPHAVDRQVVEKTQRLQGAAREAGLFVCYCATVFRPGYVEISERKPRYFGFGTKYSSTEGTAVIGGLSGVYSAVVPMTWRFRF